MIIIKIFYTVWIFNYALVKKSYKKDNLWKGRQSNIISASFANLMLLLFAITYSIEAITDTNYLSAVMLSPIPLIVIALGFTVILYIVFKFLFSILNKRYKHKLYKKVASFYLKLTRLHSIVIQAIILLFFFYTIFLIIINMPID